jgi:uncharacterized membrane protein
MKIFAIPFFIKGTFAVISLMTAQAIGTVLPLSINSVDHNQTSFSFSDQSESLIISHKISIASTLALLVGLIQVSFDN